jgi:hypothetical protein
MKITVIGTVLYGKKVILQFAVISALVGIPFGMLIAVFNLMFYGNGPYSKWLDYMGNIDINFLTMALAIGIGLCLNIGVTKSKFGMEPSS